LISFIPCKAKSRSLEGDASRAILSYFKPAAAMNSCVTRFWKMADLMLPQIAEIIPVKKTGY
jgi:hypothetical protein